MATARISIKKSGKYRAGTLIFIIPLAPWNTKKCLYANTPLDPVVLFLGHHMINVCMFLIFCSVNYFNV